MERLQLIGHFLAILLLVSLTQTSLQGNVTQTADVDMRFVLLHDLFENYNSAIRPVRNISDAVNVTISVALNQLIELRWTDEFLRWDPADYGGTEHLFVSLDSIWGPDIVIYNSVDQERTAFEVIPRPDVKVFSSGVVRWNSPVVAQTMCRIKVEKYPFDEQSCPLKFGSWAYDGFAIDLHLEDGGDSMDMTSYIYSVEWQVSSTLCERNVIKYGCCPEPYPDVTCYVRMRRLPMFYLFNLVFPCVLLIIIGLLVFCLPPESGEKVSLAITVLLAMTVFMLLVMENIPPNSEAIPLLEQFIGGTIALLTLSTLLSVWVVNLSFRGTLWGRPPRWLRFLLLEYGSYLVCMNRQAHAVTHQAEQDLFRRTLREDQRAHVCGDGCVALVSVSSRDAENTKSETQNGPVTSRKTDRTGRSGSPQKERPVSPKRQEKHGETVPLLRSILAELQAQHKYRKSKHSSAESDSNNVTEWMLIAVIVDRFFFWILLTAAVVMSVIVFMGR